MDTVLPFPETSSKTARIYHAWILPLFGFGLGLACAYLAFWGLLETWRFAGSPGERIARILGVREGHTLLVATETGSLYALDFGAEEGVALPARPAWQRESLDTVDPVSQKDWGADFLTWPPLFRVQQLHELEYLYRVEGKGEVKFALAPDGHIWMWNHQNSGLAGLVFYFYPVMGFLAGLVATVLVWGIRRASPQSTRQ